MYNKRYWSIAEGYKLTGKFSRRYSNRDQALNACMSTARCKGVTEYRRNYYYMCSDSVLTVESAMNAFVPGGELVTYIEYDMVYVGYSWEYKSPFTLTGDYQDNTVYKTRDAALSACAAADACKGVTKEGKNNFRLATTGTFRYSKNKAVWVQNGAVIRDSGFNWSQHPHLALSGYSDGKIYRTRDKALGACAKSSSCKGVTREGELVFRLMSGTTLKPNSASTTYVKSSQLFISSDFYWTRVKGYNFRHQLGRNGWGYQHEALRECAKRRPTCVGTYTAPNGVKHIAQGTDLDTVAKGEIYIMGSSYNKEWFFVYGGNYHAYLSKYLPQISPFCNHF